MLRKVERLAQATRAPQPRRVLPAPERPAAQESVVAIASGPDVAAAARAVAAISASPTTGDALLIPDIRPDAAVGARTLLPVAEWFNPSSRVSIGIPSTTERETVRRWRRLADDMGYRFIRLGDEGWDRIEFAGQTELLRNAGIPAELSDAGQVVLLSKVGAGASATGIWRGIVHPNTALRASLNPKAAIELSAAVDALYVLSGQMGAASVLALTGDRIAAELVATGLYYLSEEREGYEAQGPWESPAVQHLSELALGVTTAANLVLRAAVPDNAPGQLTRLAELLNCRIELAHSRGGERD